MHTTTTTTPQGERTPPVSASELSEAKAAFPAPRDQEKGSHRSHIIKPSDVQSITDKEVRRSGRCPPVGQLVRSRSADRPGVWGRVSACRKETHGIMRTREKEGMGADGWGVPEEGFTEQWDAGWV